EAALLALPPPAGPRGREADHRAQLRPGNERRGALEGPKDSKLVPLARNAGRPERDIERQHRRGEQTEDRAELSDLALGAESARVGEREGVVGACVVEGDEFGESAGAPSRVRGAGDAEFVSRDPAREHHREALEARMIRAAT